MDNPLYHRRVRIDPDNPRFGTIKEWSSTPAIIRESRIYAVRYTSTEDGYDVIRAIGDDIISIGQYDHNDGVGNPDIGRALRDAKGLPVVRADRAGLFVFVDLQTPSTYTRVIIHPFPIAKVNDRIIQIRKELALLS